jgi:signal transduction histidine kinase
MLLSMLIGAGCGLWQVEMDPSQLDQVLTNLRVNARDAINGVGMITIEAENCDVDAEYCASYVGLMPREYVRLTVCDTGSGMDATTQTQIFEPFFTTKAVGKGTGLGLATVYGAIKQNNGYIAVFSELGRGTMFEIYLPRCRLNA